MTSCHAGLQHATRYRALRMNMQEEGQREEPSGCTQTFVRRYSSVKMFQVQEEKSAQVLKLLQLHERRDEKEEEEKRREEKSDRVSELSTKRSGGSVCRSKSTKPTVRILHCE